MDRNMSVISLLTIILLNMIIRSGSIDEKLHPKTRKSLEFLCPGVDICDKNATSATPNLHKVVNKERGFVSCCQSCSCHSDCHKNLNCCFPDGVTHDNDVSTDTDGKGDISSIEGDMVRRKHAKETTEKRAVTYKECVYAQTGVPDDTWMFYVPAYRIVTKPPEQGCFVARDRLKSSCDPDVTSACSDLFPVYSEQERTIYKNEFCARCHGVDNFVSWTPLLACTSYDADYDRFIPFAEHIHFFEYDNCNASINNCHIQFIFDDVEVLQENRCFIDSFGTCELVSNDTDMIIPGGLNMTQEEVVSACHSGLVSPVARMFRVYTNVFCAICNDDLRKVPVCVSTTESWRGNGRPQLTFLLDTSFVKNNFRKSKMHNHPANPKACLLNGSEKIVESCRDVFCPSGQVRKQDGTCYHPSKRIFNMPFLLILQLDYIDTSQSALMAYTTDELNSTFGSLNSSLILNTFEATSPWPPYWKIDKVLHTTPGGMGTYIPRAAVELSTDIISIDIVVKDIKTFTLSIWNITFHNQRIKFRQDILGYVMKYDLAGELVPKWKYYDDRINSSNHDTSVGFTLWADLHSFFRKYYRHEQYQISKLLICEQVELEQHEYILSEQRYLLYNKLTERIMFDKQFDIVSYNQQYGVRVCLSDTPLEVEPKSSRAHGFVQRLHLAFVLIWVWLQLQVKMLFS